LKLKHIITICIASSILFIGCGKNETSAPNSTVATSSTTVYKSTTTVKPKNTLMDIYFENMSEYFPKATKAELLDIGEQACAVIDAFGSVSSALAAIATDPDFANMQYEVGITIGSAVPVLCPEYEAELRRIVNS